MQKCLFPILGKKSLQRNFIDQGILQRNKRRPIKMFHIFGFLFRQQIRTWTIVCLCFFFSLTKFFIFGLLFANFSLGKSRSQRSVLPKAAYSFSRERISAFRIWSACFTVVLTAFSGIKIRVWDRQIKFIRLFLRKSVSERGFDRCLRKKPDTSGKIFYFGKQLFFYRHFCR